MEVQLQHNATLKGRTVLLVSSPATSTSGPAACGKTLVISHGFYACAASCECRKRWPTSSMTLLHSHPVQGCKSSCFL